MQPCILSLGSLNADFQMRLDRPVGSAETLQASCLRRMSGGKAANVAVVAKRLGHGAAVFGMVGQDDLASQVLEPLRQAGVDTRHVGRARQAPTAISVIAVPPSGKKHIMLAAEANLAFEDEDIAALREPLMAAADGSVLVCDYEVSPGVVSAALRWARERGIRTVVDPSFPRSVPEQDLALIQVLTPNEEEACALAGLFCDGASQELTEVAQCLAAMGPEIVCIKRKNGGCLLRTPEGRVMIDAAPVDVVDATGAGDAFTGTFAVGLLEGRTPLESAIRATAASELAVTVFGSQSAYPGLPCLEEQVRSTERRITRC